MFPKIRSLRRFQPLGMQMDYPDKAPENEKQRLAEEFERQLTAKRKSQTADKLRALLGKPAINTYSGSGSGRFGCDSAGNQVSRSA